MVPNIAKLRPWVPLQPENINRREGSRRIGNPGSSEILSLAAIRLPNSRLKDFNRFHLLTDESGRQSRMDAQLLGQ